MNNSFARLVDGTCHTLRTEVLTRIADEYARSQVWGVINLLNTLKVRGDWSAGFILEQIEAQRQALAAAAQALADVAGAPGAKGTLAAPAPPGDTIEPALPVTTAPTVRELLAARDEGNRRIARLLDWMSAAGADVDAIALAKAEAALLGAMRTEVEIELKNSPRPLFAQMSGADEA